MSSSFASYFRVISCILLVDVAEIKKIFSIIRCEIFEEALHMWITPIKIEREHLVKRVIKGGDR